MPQFNESHILVSLDELAEYADRRRQAAIARSGPFPGLPVYGAAWTILLHLFAENARGRAVRQLAAFSAAGVPLTTGLRHVSALVAQGHIARGRDVKDRRASPVSLTESGITAIVSLLTHELSLTWGLPVLLINSTADQIDDSLKRRETDAQEPQNGTDLAALRERVESLTGYLRDIAIEIKRHTDRSN